MKKLTTLISLGLLLVSASGTALAETKYKVDMMRYENKGAYSVDPLQLRFLYEKSDGSKVKCTISYERESDIFNNETIPYNLATGGNNLWEPAVSNPSACPERPQEGNEVWMIVNIYRGDKESCRKDNTKFYYYKDGGTVKYVTKGTSLNNNRCRINSKPSNQHIFQ